MSRNGFRALALLAALVAVALVALPVLGVDPSGSPSAAPSSTEPSAEPASEAPAESAAPSAPAPSAPEAAPPSTAEPEPREDDEQGGGQPERPDKAAKPDKGPEVAVTVTGIVGRSTDNEGDYTLTSGLNIYKLSAGPKWWWGEDNPLEDAVNNIVTVEGEQAEGSDEIDVLKINGTAIREAGKPPWAGGWKVVGAKHPGWAQWKVDKLTGTGVGHGKDTAPGQLKKDAEGETP